MIISILGNLIDTEDIYQITPILTKDESHFEHKFFILFFNREKFYVSNYAGVYSSGHTIIGRKERNNEKEVYIKICDKEEYFVGTVQEATEYLKKQKPYINSLQSITNLRDKIV